MFLDASKTGLFPFFAKISSLSVGLGFSLDPKRIERYVTTEFQKMSLFIDQNGFESPSK
jgi:hypothetical protein